MKAKLSKPPWDQQGGDLGRTLVMGVVNVTPDSFSDGGRYFRAEAAIAHGHALIAEGADIIDVGGESTRPGASPTSSQEEIRRIVPVIKALAPAGVPISVDTMHSATARAAVAAGAVIINDVSGGLADPAMLDLAAELGTGYVLMHWRAPSESMAQHAHYGDVAAEVAAELSAGLERARVAGIAAHNLILDPGIGFAKTAEHNWALLAHLDPVAALGKPLLLGVSRKAFLGRLLADENGVRPVGRRDDAAAALTAHLAAAGVWAVRTHTVAPHRDAVEVIARLRAEKSADYQPCSRLGATRST